MKRSTDRILTTHTGSLPRPPDFAELLLARERGEPIAPEGSDWQAAIALRDKAREATEAQAL